MKTSRYNFKLPFDDYTLIYNSNSGAVEKLEGASAARLAELLTGPVLSIPANALPEPLIAKLRAGGFVTPDDCDEKDVIRQRFWGARRETPIALTITTTQDCNLGCYYCYEDRTGDRLELEDVDAVVALARERLTRRGKKSLHVDWYGGEPFLNLDFMEAASYALQAFCAERGVDYHASAISNGTRWPDDPAAFVARHKIRQVQISFDGMRANHDKRRRYRKGYKPSADASSFDLAVAVVDKLAGAIRVDVRFNIDRGNLADLGPFIDMMRQRGWFRSGQPLSFQPARLASYSDRSSFMRDVELSVDEYDEVRAWVRSQVAGEALLEESEMPEGFAYPRNSVCAALADDSVVLGAEGGLYRCGLQVGERDRIVGEVKPNAAPQASDADWWRTFDPTELPTCAQCSFLPICWGGCPKKHLERDIHALREQSAYWRQNLPRVIASTVGREPPASMEYGIEDQFRDGAPEAFYQDAPAEQNERLWPMPV